MSLARWEFNVGWQGANYQSISWVTDLDGDDGDEAEKFSSTVSDEKLQK